MLRMLCTMLPDKQTLRRRFLAKRAAQAEQIRQEVSREITERLLQSTFYRRAGCVFCYVSTKEEIDTVPLLARMLADGKVLCVPKCGAHGSMTARRIHTLEELQPGAFGIPEPPDTAEQVPAGRIDLIVAPALACDRAGYRLGYGGGYYDRFMEHCRAVSVALCDDSRLVDQLPTTPFDQKCRHIITERQVLHPDEE